VSASTTASAGHSGNDARKPNVPRLTIVAGVFLIVLGTVAGLLAWKLYRSDPAANSREAELLKACLGVLSVALVGGIVSAGLLTLQRERDRHYEDARRRADRLVDQRRRLDGEVRETLNDTLRHYHAVKRIRRELEAVTSDGGSGTIGLEDYDRYMRQLNRHQLGFEQLKRTAPLLEQRLVEVLKRAPGEAPPSKPLAEVYASIEDYLNDVIDEYQRCRYLTKADGLVSLAELAGQSSAVRGVGRARQATLLEFVFDTSVFRSGAATEVDEVISRLEGALLA
jgi:hypothetical protein